MVKIIKILSLSLFLASVMISCKNTDDDDSKSDKAKKDASTLADKIKKLSNSDNKEVATAFSELLGGKKQDDFKAELQKAASKLEDKKAESFSKLVKSTLEALGKIDDKTTAEDAKDAAMTAYNTVSVIYNGLKAPSINTDSTTPGTGNGGGNTPAKTLADLKALYIETAKEIVKVTTFDTTNAGDQAKVQMLFVELAARAFLNAPAAGDLDGTGTQNASIDVTAVYTAVEAIKAELAATLTAANQTAILAASDKIPNFKKITDITFDKATDNGTSQAKRVPLLKAMKSIIDHGVQLDAPATTLTVTKADELKKDIDALKAGKATPATGGLATAATPVGSILGLSSAGWLVASKALTEAVKATPTAVAPSASDWTAAIKK